MVCPVFIIYMTNYSLLLISTPFKEKKISILLNYDKHNSG